MPMTSSRTATCDVCGINFEPTKNQRQAPGNRITCRDAACRSKVASIVRRETEERRWVAKAEAKLPVMSVVEPLQSIGTCPQKPTICHTWQPDLAGHKAVAVASDLHLPYGVPDVIDAFLSLEADICIINGDLGDMYSFSRFVKYHGANWQQEKAECTDFLRRASEAFETVIVIPGNHDARFVKRLAENIGTDELAELLDMAGESGVRLDPLGRMAAQFPNVHMPSRNVEGIEVAWFYQMGDAIFCHGESYSSAGTNLVPRKVEEYFRRHAALLNLQPWRFACQAHTHNLSWTLFNSDQLVVECGCMSKAHDYQLSPKMQGSPQRRGWVTFEMTDGCTDLNSVRLFNADTAGLTR